MRASFLFLTLLVAAPAARADVCTWTSDSDGDWTTGTNWSCGHAPGAADAALIQNGRTVSLNADVSVTSFSLNTGSSLTGSGTLTVTGSMAWASGGLRGTGTTVVAAGATLTLAGDGQRSLTNQRQFINEGTATWSGTGSFSNDNAGSAFVNRGLLELSASSPSVFQSIFFAGQFINEAGGTVRKTGGTSLFSSVFSNAGTVEVDEGTLRLTAFSVSSGTDTGTYEVAAGAVLDFGGTRTVTATGLVTGGGTLRVTTAPQVVFDGTLDIPTLDMGTGANPTFVLNTDATVETFALAIGSLGGSGDLTVTGSGTWASGSMSGTGTTLVAAGATLTMSGDAQRSLTGQRQFINEGTATWSGSGSFSNSNEGAAFVNRGTLAVTASRPVNQALFFAGRFVNEAGATLTLSPAQHLEFASVFDNAGAVAVTSGNVAMTGFNGPGGTDTGTYTVAAGAVLAFRDIRTVQASGSVSGAGTLQVASRPTAFDGTLDVAALVLAGFGTLTLSTDATVETLSITGGALAGSGDLTVTSAMTWADGAMRGTGTTLVEAGATLTISGATSRTLGGDRQLVNEGTATWSGTGGFSNEGGGNALVNRGAFTVTASLPSGGFLFGSGHFVNEAAGTVTFSPAQDAAFASRFSNAGAVAVTSGTFRVSTNASSTDTGSYAVAAGATLDFGDVRTLSPGAVITGTGTVVQRTTQLSNGATVRPGTSPGALAWTLLGGIPYAPTANAVLDVELGGAAPGTGYDRLAVTGSATMNGTVRVAVVGGFQPAVGDRFAVVTCTVACSGAATAAAVDAGYAYLVEVGAQQVEVVVTAAPVPVVLTLTGAEGWRMLAPAYTDDTYDDLLGPLWTQGFPGADSPDGTPNAYTYDEAVTTDTNGDGTATRDDGYAPLGEQSASAPTGRGLFAYVYADDDANAPGQQGGFPKTIPQSGTAYAGPFPAPFAVSFTSSGSPDDDGWLLLGNPFDAGMDWDATGWTRTNVSSAIYVWDPNAAGGPQYLTWSTGIGGSLPDGVVAPNQGFWAKATGAAPVLEAPAAARVAGGTFHGRSARSTSDSTTVVALRLDGAVGGRPLATTAHVAFLDGAATGLDAHDAYELAPLAAPSLLLYTAADGPALDIDVRPVPTGPVEVALGVEARAEGPSVPATLTLSWPALRALPAEWAARLEDRQTGATVDLRQTPSYTFETTTEPAPGVGPGAPTGASALHSGAPRFALVLGPATTTASGPSAPPAVLALHPPRPNPAAQAATVRVDLPAAAHATLAVYDMLGREVAVLLREERPAGRHDVALDAGALAPGVYVLRLTTEAGALTRRLVVAR